MVLTDRSKLLILWTLFLMYAALIVWEISRYIGGEPVRFAGPIFLLFVGFPIVTIFLHAVWTLSLSRASLFLLISASIGFTAEYFGMQTGMLFGGHYVYNANEPHILGVLIAVPFFWFAFTYLCYCITSSTWMFLGFKKPHLLTGKLWHLPLLVVVDAMLLLSIDLIIDPLEVLTGRWEWLEGGWYFGVPLGNFLGWIIVAVIISGLFRSFEFYTRPSDVTVSSAAYLLPLGGFLVLYVRYSVLAMYEGLFAVALIGTALMVPVALVNFTTFLHARGTLNFIRSFAENKIRMVWDL